MPQGPTTPPVPPAPIRPRGRKTESTRRLWGQIRPRLVQAGHPLGGALPRKSLNLSMFANPYAWYQQRGFCVGWALAACAIETYRIPNGANPNSRPIETPAFSPLYSYAISRMEARNRRVNLGGEDGSICSFAVEAAARDGFVLWDEMPATPQRENAWNNLADAPGSLIQRGRDRVLLKYASCTTLDQGLEHLAAGFLLYAGLPCYEGMTRTDAEGRFDPLAGRHLGGHAVRFMHYDLDADELWMGNSWPQWGRRGAGPNGYTNVGIGKLSSFRRLLSDRFLSDGTSELFAINAIQGEQPGDPFTPKVFDPFLIAA